MKFTKSVRELMLKKIIIYIIITKNYILVLILCDFRVTEEGRINQSDRLFITLFDKKIDKHFTYP